MSFPLKQLTEVANPEDEPDPNMTLSQAKQIYERCVKEEQENIIKNYERNEEGEISEDVTEEGEIVENPKETQAVPEKPPPKESSPIAIVELDDTDEDDVDGSDGKSKLPCLSNQKPNKFVF